MVCVGTATRAIDIGKMAMRPPNVFPKWTKGRKGHWKKQYAIVEPTAGKTLRVVVGPSLGKNEVGEEQEAFVRRILYDLGIENKECSSLFGRSYEEIAKPGRVHGIKDVSRKKILSELLELVEKRTARLMAIRMRLSATVKKESANDWWDRVTHTE